MSPDATLSWSPSVTDLMHQLPERRSIDVNGLPISYRDKGTGQPILFLHGLLGSADSWVLQMLSLSAKVRVIAWDAPGYGQSADMEPDLEMFAEQLRGFIKALALPSLTLVGHSMGGTLAARIAADPVPLLDRLVISCSHAGYGEPADTPPSEKLVERIHILKQQGAEAYGRSRATHMVAHPVDPFALELAAYVAAGTRADGLYSATRMLQFADLRPFYKQIRLPTWILFGGADPVVRPDLSAELKSLTPQATHITLPNVGHAPYLEDAEGYEAVLAPILETSLPSR